jgi:hypothetical protein
VIDDDLGRSGSGLVERPGFQRLVGEVCTGEVGAVFSIEASRLARNGRDWHYLIELCGMVVSGNPGTSTAAAPAALRCVHGNQRNHPSTISSIRRSAAANG